MKTAIRVRNTKTILQSAAFFLALFSTTALPILTNLPIASANTDTYPSSIGGCRAVSGTPPGSFTCDLKNSTQDLYYDPWGEENRECTSYAAWMLHSVNGFEMPFYDDAVNWGTRATALGYTVNMTPKVGSIFWNTATDHVGWVESVSANGSTINYLDYNSDFNGHWGEQTNIATNSASGYIHFKDLSPGYQGPMGLMWANPTDIPITGDWNGDGVSDVGVVRDNAFYRRDPVTGVSMPTINFGSGVNSGDVPMVGDWNGDGISDIGVVRGRSFLRRDPVTGNAMPTISFGEGIAKGDIPITGDWNGDGVTDIGVVRDHDFLRRDPVTGNAMATISFGYGIDQGDLAMTGDWDGNGITDIGVIRDNDFIRRAANGTAMTTISFGYGIDRDDIGITGDWNGDGVTDIGIVRGNSFIRRDPVTGNAMTTISFGLGGVAWLP